MSNEFTVAGRYQPNAGKSSYTLQKPAVQAERSAAVSALAAAAPIVVPVTETPAEAYAIALSKIYVTINGVQHPFSDLQSSKKGKEGPLEKIDFDLKHVRERHVYYNLHAASARSAKCQQFPNMAIPSLPFPPLPSSPLPSPPSTELSLRR
jgi:hypothetical protein